MNIAINNTMNIKFSIITVCYNAENIIVPTIDSIINQKYNNYEYIIIDGLSTDNTIKIVSKYKNAFNKKNVELYIVSEKDKGIYNAMNKAISLCHGDFVFYLNAGDCFYDEYVLNNVSNYINAKSLILYGDVVGVCGSGEKIIHSGKAHELLWRLPFCHQGVFTSKELLTSYKFDEKFKICADYDLFLRMFLDLGEYAFKKLDLKISYYDENGLSTINNGIDSRIEMAQIQYKNRVISFLVLNYKIVKCNAKKMLIKLKDMHS